MIGLLLPLLLNNLLSEAVPVVTFPAVCFEGTACNPTVSGVTNAVTLTGDAENPTFTGRVVSCN